MRIYKPKGSGVKAFQFTADEADACRKWCFGLIEKGEDGVLRLLVPSLSGALYANLGDYVCLSDNNGFSVEEGMAFENRYEPVRRSSGEN
jgi:hypothetical protein